MISQFASRYVEVGGALVHEADFGGQGRPVVLVHGLGGSFANWVSVAGGLTGLGHVTAIDFPGFGLSPAGSMATVSTHRQVLDSYLRSLGGPALVVANSMGGAVAIRQAAAAPETVDGLVLISPASPLADNRLPDPEVTGVFALYLFPGLARTALAARRKRMTAEEVAAWTLDMCTVRSSRIPPDVFDLHVEVAKRRLHMPGGDRALVSTANSLLRALVRRREYDRAVVSVSAPTLLIQGREDRLVRPESSLRLGAIRPDWDIQILEDVGHVAMLEVPATLVGSVTGWAREAAAA